MKVAIIGGGAAGFFSAIAVKENYPESQVTIYEKTQKLLAKVKVSGGGRCNVTNGCTSIKELSEGYPRGGKFMKRALRIFNTTDTMEWFESHGVPLKIEPDNRVFPKSNDSQSIVDCLLEKAEKLGIKIIMETGVTGIQPISEGLQLHFTQELESQIFNKVIVASGGSPKRSSLNWLELLGHKIENPVPSLFTFNIPKNPVTKLMGLVAERAQVSIQGSRLKAQGPLLITHWGLSGPAVLKLSAFGARWLSDKKYIFNVQVNWVSEPNSERVMQGLNALASQHPNKLLPNIRPYQLPDRLWLFLLDKCELPKSKKWSELGKKGMNKLTNILTNDIYSVKGKTTFKEEFVTCGGVSFESIDSNTMQSTACPNLYFAGELMDIDGITGGYNFQAAWTTAFIAGKLG